jgi:hypothetical protein
LREVPRARTARSLRGPCTKFFHTDASPPPGEYHGDFLIALTTATAGTTICYTQDGVTTPACDANANCTAGKQYNATAEIPINPAVTDANGYVTVQAIACVPGMTSGVAGPWTYRRL